MKNKTETETVTKCDFRCHKNAGIAYKNIFPNKIKAFPYKKSHILIREIRLSNPWKKFVEQKNLRLTLRISKM